MLSWLRKFAMRAPRLEDPTFGTLTYMGGYWEGAGQFPPTKDAVEYFVTADEHGPTDANRDAFRFICAHYPELEIGARAAISAAIDDAAAGNALFISSLDVPAGDMGSTTWEISFSDAAGALFSVEFRGLEATGNVEVSR
ncbi:hypothetical protein [Pseudoxanthomonas putridarboris]|uniref:Uncharacterized protein n=1 Tax=Pseudoxanthomonas putridarboris TaxID=752605 RepID=A0ABU9IZW7_9GAMM